MHRRRFIQHTATSMSASLLASGVLSGRTANAAQPNVRLHSRPPKLDGVQLAIATICTDGFGNRHHEPAMKFIPEFGFKNVELNLWYPNQITPRYISQLKQRCADTGLTPISVQGSSFGAEGRHALMKDYSHKLLMMQYARQLGCNIVSSQDPSGVRKAN